MWLDFCDCGISVTARVYWSRRCIICVCTTSGSKVIQELCIWPPSGQRSSRLWRHPNLWIKVIHLPMFQLCTIKGFRVIIILIFLCSLSTNEKRVFYHMTLEPSRDAFPPIKLLYFITWFFRFVNVTIFSSWPVTWFVHTALNSQKSINRSPDLRIRSVSFEFCQRVTASTSLLWLC